MSSTLRDSAEGTQTWTVDPAHTLVEFAVKHMMLTTVKGRFTNFTGAVTAGESDGESWTAEVEIEAATIETGAAQRDEHLRSGDFLDVATHPKLVFQTTEVSGGFREAGDRFEVKGELTIRGTTREVRLDVTFEGRGQDPWGGERMSFNATTKIDRRDFGLTYNQALETGGVLVGNEVKIELDVQVVRAN